MPSLNFPAARRRDQRLVRTRRATLWVAGGAAAASLGLGTAFAHALPGHQASAAGSRSGAATAGTQAQGSQAQGSQAQGSQAQGTQPRHGAKAHSSKTQGPPLSQPTTPPSTAPASPQAVSGGS
ncbi:MAG TPA: hypothetical protein VGJ50_28755 [Streptosporangiaceae bacterium]